MAIISHRFLSHSTLLAAMLVASGCAHMPIADTIATAQRDTGAYTGSQIGLAPASLPASPLGQAAAVELMLKNSRELQALIASRNAEQNEARATALPFTPGLDIERSNGEDGLSLSRSLSISLMDLITWPSRQERAKKQVRLQQLQLAQDIAARVTAVRLGWVEAVAATQRRHWAEQARESADAGAELANRLQQAGNISEASRLQRQTSLHEADSRLDAARSAERQARYALAELLGLTPAQADSLRLPDRFPALPQRPPTTDRLAREADEARLDVRIARQQLRVAAASAGLMDIASLGDAELGLTRESNDGRATSLGLSLPVFDGGVLERASEDQRTAAAVHALQETLTLSALRSDQVWATWKQRYDTSVRYRDKVIPEQVALSAETLKRYNGMLIDVFDLLEDAQRQVDTLEHAIEAEAAFWKADVLLQAALFGLGEDQSGGSPAHGEAR